MRRPAHASSVQPAMTQRGFSIVEVLVAAVILSIGMLGLAGLQMRTLRNNQSALERGIAVVETHAISDALRGDRVNASNGLFNLALAAADPTPGTFANTVLAGWRQNLRAELGPTATGEVACNGFLCQITVRWDDTHGAVAASTLSVVTSVQI